MNNGSNIYGGTFIGSFVAEAINYNDNVVDVSVNRTRASLNAISNKLSS